MVETAGALEDPAQSGLNSVEEEEEVAEACQKNPQGG